MGQNSVTDDFVDKVLIDNNKIKVVEHNGVPKGNVCGIGIHHHDPHLTIALTDANVQITPENGEPHEMEVKSGTSIWFNNAETHSVTNIGNEPTKMILVYLKKLNNCCHHDKQG